MNITVINIHRSRKPVANYIYIGRHSGDRFSHYGNPFTHIDHANLATVKVATREDAVQAYEDWLRGVKWHNVEPERRQWIRDRIKHLAQRGDDLTLGCFCRPANGFTNDHTCHGQVIAQMILEARERV